jgi:hypothetical protein
MPPLCSNDARDDKAMLRFKSCALPTLTARNDLITADKLL